MSTAAQPIQVTIRRNPLAGWIADRPVRIKSLISALVVALVAIGITVGSVSRMGHLNGHLEEMKTKHLESMAQLAAVRQGIGEMYKGMTYYGWGAYQPEYIQRGRQYVRDGDARISEALTTYRTLTAGSAAREQEVDTFASTFAAYSNMRNVVLFREPPAAGLTLPSDAAGQNQLWQGSEAQMTASLAKLQELETTEAEAMATEAREAYESARMWVIASLIVGLLLAMAVGLWIARLMGTQLNTVSDTLRAVADGDLTRKAEVRSRDELGGMAVAVNQASEGIRQTVETLATGARTLGGSSEQLTRVTAQIAGSAQAAAAQANVVSGDAGTVSHNVQTVAAGSEEMGASIREIAQNANDAARVASEAVGVAESTNRTVSKLGDSSTEIGNVVKVITSIAEQTNLLALNATIEAARAGAAGKGFAVVASEVKDLAQETARATEDISRRVEAIQSDTANAVEAIGEISRIIARINDYQLTIASAVEEQTATTNEMSRSVSDAAHGAANIAANIAGVADAAHATTSTLGQADATVNELARLSRDLQSAVGRFRV